MTPAVLPGPRALDLVCIREDFPLLARRVHGKPLVYLDGAASLPMAQVVIDRLDRYHAHEHANVHRGVHWLSQAATDAYEQARERVARFLNAHEAREVVFTRGATEAINLVAASWGRRMIGPGDEILVSVMEHHANLVPWQALADERGAVLRAIPMTDAGELDLVAYRAMLSPRTRLVAVAHASNVLGTVHPVAEMAASAHAVGAVVVVDGAQAVAHMPVDVRALDADFYVFSGHKLGAPTGIGALWGRAALLERMPPYQLGGGMIGRVSFERTTYAGIPQRFEAGTPPIAAAIGLATAIDYLDGLGLAAIAAHGEALARYAVKRLGALPGVRLLGAPARRVPVLSFVVEGVHAHDVGSLLDLEGIAVRSGHHCAEPLMARLGVGAAVRASFSLFNVKSEIDVLAAALRQVQAVFR
jgi:cysteine desulfurase/selenocysteine lyase